MSSCVSRHGEWSEHTPDEEFTCTRCGALDEDGLRAELADARKRLAAVETLVLEAVVFGGRLTCTPAEEEAIDKLMIDFRTALANVDASEA